MSLGLILFEKWKEVGGGKFDNICIRYKRIPASLYYMITVTVYQSYEAGMARVSHGRNKKLISGDFL